MQVEPLGQDDEWVWREIISPTITRYVRRRCHGLPPEEQDDIIQDAHIRCLIDTRHHELRDTVARGETTQENDLRIRTVWLTRFVIFDYFGDRGHGPPVVPIDGEIVGDDGDSLRLIELIPSDEPDPLAEYLDRCDKEEQRKRIRRIWELISELVETQRVVVVMRLQGLPFKQIAEILTGFEGAEVDAGALRVRHTAATRRLGQLYRERYPDDPWLE